MRAEKQFLTKEYVERLSESPYAVVVEYEGLTVDQFTDLRKQLIETEAELHVVKNSMFRLAAKEVGLPDLSGLLTGQLSVITGQKDVSGAAKVVQKFAKEVGKPKFRFGFMGDQQLDADQLEQLANLPPLEVLRAQLLGVLNAPAEKLVRLVNTPASQLAQVLKAYAEKEGDSGE
jgi:large subunit ribosomal protein L10